MWTRKASFTFTGGIALILIGMMISNHQMMILGISFIAFIMVNSWVSGHADVEVYLESGVGSEFEVALMLRSTSVQLILSMGCRCGCVWRCERWC